LDFNSRHSTLNFTRSHGRSDGADFQKGMAGDGAISSTRLVATECEGFDKLSPNGLSKGSP